MAFSAIVMLVDFLGFDCFIDDWTLALCWIVFWLAGW